MKNKIYKMFISISLGLMFLVFAFSALAQEADLSITKTVRVQYPTTTLTAAPIPEPAEASSTPPEIFPVPVEPPSLPPDSSEPESALITTPELPLADSLIPPKELLNLAAVIALVAAPLAVIISRFEIIAQGLRGVTSLSEIWLLLLKMFYGLLSLFGLRKKRTYWGTVYDSLTKQPLDPAIVKLIDAASGRVIGQSITDLAGRYGFLAGAGSFKLDAAKTHYQFPSSQIIGGSDGIFDQLYHGEEIAKNSQTDVIAPNVPMDPLAFDWNQQDKLRLIKFHPVWENLKNIFFSGLFYLGFVLTAVNCWFNPDVQSFLFLLIYILFALVHSRLGHLRLWGRVYFRSSHLPASNFLLQLSPAGITSVVLSRAKAAADGKYFLKAPPGEYILTVKNEQNIDVAAYSITAGKAGFINNNIPV